MNIVFLSLVDIDSINERGIYPDLLRKFHKEGHDITIVTPRERRKKVKTCLIKSDRLSILKVKTLNIQKANLIEKGFGTLAIEFQFLSAIKKYLKDEKFDLILYATPPITLVRVIEFIKKRDKAYSYLLLKDIFPQNAVDMKMLKEGGFIHKQFVKKEKKLYKISDTIGCMSPANVGFLLKHNPELVDKVELNPNSIEPIVIAYTKDDKESIRKKYDLPLDKKVFVYGGNLGKPQGLDFLLETISATKNEDVYFLIVGNGTEFLKIKEWFNTNQPKNANLLQQLPKEDYDRLLAACDIGLIFLDRNFLIPNFPSRLLSYFEMKLPVLVASDLNTDIGTIVEDNKCGYKVEAGNQVEMQEKINLLMQANLSEMGAYSERLLYKDYLVEKSYHIIMNRISHV